MMSIPSSRPMRPVFRHVFEEEILPVLREEAVEPQPLSPADQRATPQDQPALGEYKREALEMIGGRDRDVRERNDAISGAYAALYMKNKDAFRWPGAAAHASTQVGLSMDVFNGDKQFDAAVSGLVPALPAGAGVWALGQTKWNPQIVQMFAEGNIAIFENIFPPSLAYHRGGIEELRRLEKTLAGDRIALQDFRPIVTAYEDIDRGIKLKQQGEIHKGEALIQRGTDKIIEHEQIRIAQPEVFGKNKQNRLLSTMLSPFAFGDFDGNPNKVDLSTLSTLRGWQPDADLGDPNERVEWIKKGVFPTWHRLHLTEPAKVHKGMKDMIRRGQAAGGRY